jgi:hypothetical protein
MKYLLTLLLFTTLLLSCSNPAGRAVENIGSQVKKCCVSFSVDKNADKPNNSVCTETGEASSSSLPTSVFEVSGILPTW